MKYVVFTFDGYGLPIARQLQLEGNDVVVAVVDDFRDVISELEKNVAPESKAPRQRRLSQYDGILEKRSAGDMIESLLKADPEDHFLFFDLNHLFRFAEKLRDRCFLGNFPTTEDFLLEIDRGKAKDFVAANYPGVRVAEKQQFKRSSEAKAFLSQSEDIWVLKGLEEDARTVVPDVEDVDLAHGQVLEALTQHPEEYESAGFILELMIKNAIELTPERIYFDGKPVASCMCIENKQMGAGNVGPMTGCAQDLVFETAFEDKINQIAFPAIVDEMAAHHPGLFWWDASLYCDPRTGKVYFGEFCANRPGYNCLYSEMALAGSAAKYFESLVAGKSPYAANSVAASARLFNFHRDAEGMPLAGSKIAYKPRVERHLWLTDLRQQGKHSVTAGYTPDIGVLTGVGRSVTEAARHLYRNYSEFSFEGCYCRPYFDFVSREYESSIVNRLNYGLQRGFYRIGFGI